MTTTPTPTARCAPEWRAGRRSASPRPPLFVVKAVNVSQSHRASRSMFKPARTEEDGAGLEAIELVDLAVVGHVGDEMVHVVLCWIGWVGWCGMSMGDPTHNRHTPKPITSSYVPCRWPWPPR